MESNPSATAFFSSLFVTSMQRHPNCLPSSADASGGRITGSPAASASRASAPMRSTSTSRPDGGRRLQARQPALRDRRVDRASPGHGPGRVDVRRKFHREVRLRGFVERQLGAGHREQVRRRHGEARRHDQIAGDLVARPGAWWPDGHAGDPSPAVRRQDGLSAAHVDAVGPGRPVGAQIDDGHGRAGILEEPGRAIPRLARRQHDRPPAREDAVRLDQTFHRRREHDPRQIVVREHGRLLDGPGREHDVPRADPVEGVATRGRHERPVEHAERRRRGQDPHPGVDRGRERSRLGVRLGPLLEQERVGSRRGRLGGRGEPGRAAADHEHVAMEVHHLARGVVLVPRDQCPGRPSTG